MCVEIRVCFSVRRTSSHHQALAPPRALPMSGAFPAVLPTRGWTIHRRHGHGPVHKICHSLGNGSIRCPDLRGWEIPYDEMACLMGNPYKWHFLIGNHLEAGKFPRKSINGNVNGKSNGARVGRNNFCHSATLE